MTTSAGFLAAHGSGSRSGRARVASLAVASSTPAGQPGQEGAQLMVGLTSGQRCQPARDRQHTGGGPLVRLDDRHGHARAGGRGGRLDGRPQLPRLARVVRPGSWSRPAGGSPVRVDTGVPGSRPRFVAERRRAERGVESLFGGSKHAGRSVKRTLQPRHSHNAGASRSCHGEGHAWRALFRGQPAGSCRGREGGTCAWSGPEQERPVCSACVGQRPGV